MSDNCFDCRKEIGLFTTIPIDGKKFCAACAKKHFPNKSPKIPSQSNINKEEKILYIPEKESIQRALSALLGFACVCLVGFKPFGPLALVQQAPPAIILAALLRFGGPALFHGPRTSSRLGTPFWLSGLTLRSSGLAFSQPLTLAVSPARNPLYPGHVFQTGIHLVKRLSAGCFAVYRASPLGAASVSSIFGR